MTQLDLDMQNVWRVKNQPSGVSSNSQVEKSCADINLSVLIPRQLNQNT